MRGARERAGLTQAELAPLVGYRNGQAIGLLERGEVGATTALCEQLARALGVSPAWLAWEQDGPLGLSALGYGARLRQARQEAKLTQSRLGELLGFKAGASAAVSVSLLEREQTALDLALCERAAAVLGVAAGWLGYGLPG